MENSTINGRAITALRKCGHYLHHNAGPKSGIDTETLMAPLSDEEKETLASILEKCLENWNQEK